MLKEIYETNPSTKRNQINSILREKFARHSPNAMVALMESVMEMKKEGVDVNSCKKRRDIVDLVNRMIDERNQEVTNYTKQGKSNQKRRDSTLAICQFVNIQPQQILVPKNQCSNMMVDQTNPLKRKKDETSPTMFYMQQPQTCEYQQSYNKQIDSNCKRRKVNLTIQAKQQFNSPSTPLFETRYSSSAAIQMPSFHRTTSQQHSQFEITPPFLPNSNNLVNNIHYHKSIENIDYNRNTNPNQKVKLPSLKELMDSILVQESSHTLREVLQFNVLD